ncbi:polyubiquitin-like [Epinephelus lanceolatus]
MGNWFSAETRGAQQFINSTDMGIQLKVHVIIGEKKTIDLCDTEEQLKSITVLQLKEKIIEEFGDQWQPSDLRLFCDGRELEEPALLSQCRIRHMSTILVVQRVGLPGGGPLPVDMTEVQQFINSSTDMGIWLNVHGIDRKMKTIHLCDTEEQLRGITVLQLKEKIKEEFDYQGHLSDIRLIYCGREPEEPALLSQCGIRHTSTIDVVQRLRGGGRFLPPVRGDGGMGDKDGKNRSMETITFF